jgi:hypothetical protein
MTEPVVECEVVDDSRIPLRQGDVLEWLSGGDDPWREFAIIVTADCDIAHSKHGGVLATVPVLRHEEYLARFPLPLRLAAARDKLADQARRVIREAQEANRPDFPAPMADETIDQWVRTVSADEIVRALSIADERQRRKLDQLLETIRVCGAALEDGGYGMQVGALASAQVLQNGGDPDDRSRKIHKDMLELLDSPPGDAMFLHALSPLLRGGYVAYLRHVINIGEGEIAVSARGLRKSEARARRIARLTSPYVYYLSQRLGQVFSAIGLSSAYEASRKAFIVERAEQSEVVT